VKLRIPSSEAYVSSQTDGMESSESVMWTSSARERLEEDGEEVRSELLAESSGMSEEREEAEGVTGECGRFRMEGSSDSK